MKTRALVLLLVCMLALSANPLLAQTWSSYRYTTQYNSYTNGGTAAYPQTFQYGNWVSYAIYTPYFMQRMNYYVSPSVEAMMEFSSKNFAEAFFSLPLIAMCMVY